MTNQTNLSTGERVGPRTLAQLEVFYKETLLPQLTAIDKERLKLRRTVLLLWLVTAVLAIVGVAVGSAFEEGDTSETMLSIIGAVGGIAMFNAWFLVYAYTRRKADAYVDRFKTSVIQNLVRFIDPSLTYHRDSCVSEETYTQSGLFPLPYDRYSGDDCVQGRIGKTPILFSEIHTRYKTRRTTMTNRTKDVWHDIFHGLFFICEFNKTFRGKTYVLPDKLEKIFGELGAELQRRKTHYGQLVKLEDLEFEHLFTVYGWDQIEARYILSTSLMGRLTAFKKKTRQELRIAFVESDLYVAISFNRSLFEPRIWRTVVNYDTVRTYFEDLQLVINIVEDLNLNTRIWGDRAIGEG